MLAECSPSEKDGYCDKSDLIIYKNKQNPKACDCSETTERIPKACGMTIFKTFIRKLSWMIWELNAVLKDLKIKRLY